MAVQPAIRWASLQPKCIGLVLEGRQYWQSVRGLRSLPGQEAQLEKKKRRDLAGSRREMCPTIAYEDLIKDNAITPSAQAGCDGEYRPLKAQTIRLGSTCGAETEIVVCARERSCLVLLQGACQNCPGNGEKIDADLSFVFFLRREALIS